MNPEDVSKVMAGLARLSHKKSPRTREHFVLMGRKSALAKKKKKLSTPTA